MWVSFALNRLPCRYFWWHGSVFKKKEEMRYSLNMIINSLWVMKLNANETIEWNSSSRVGVSSKFHFIWHGSLGNNAIKLSTETDLIATNIVVLVLGGRMINVGSTSIYSHWYHHFLSLSSVYSCSICVCTKTRSHYARTPHTHYTYITRPITIRRSKDNVLLKITRTIYGSIGDGCVAIPFWLHTREAADYIGNKSR
jgi:hypothetical protein